MKKVIVLGVSGQLGQCIQATDTSGLNVMFCICQQSNVLGEDHLRSVFKRERRVVVIISAAYIEVGLAEDDPLKAAAIYSKSPELIAPLCLEYVVVLI